MAVLQNEEVGCLDGQWTRALFTLPPDRGL